MTRRFTRQALVGLLILLAGCDGEQGESDKAQCSDPSAKWCEGNRLAACSNEDGEIVLHLGVDCSEHDSVCHAWEDSSGRDFVACVLPDVECDEVGDTLCITSNVIGYCEENGYYVAYGCAQYWCEEYAIEGYSSCVYEQGQCQHGDRKCFLGDAEAVLECVDGLWRNLIECEEGEECVDADEEGAVCLPANGG